MFYVYVYYDTNWQAYYVGKGQGRRRFQARSIPVADSNHQQVFYFEHEWQAWECEIELIAFWGRQCDGGILKNKSTGGEKSSAGVNTPKPDSWKKYMSERMSGSGNPRFGKPGTFLGKNHTEETKKKISKAKKGKKRPPRSEESKRKHSEFMKQWWSDRKQKLKSKDQI